MHAARRSLGRDLTTARKTDGVDGPSRHRCARVCHVGEFYWLILPSEEVADCWAPGLCGAILNLRLGGAFKCETGFDES